MVSSLLVVAVMVVVVVVLVIRVVTQIAFPSSNTSIKRSNEITGGFNDCDHYYLSVCLHIVSI